MYRSRWFIVKRQETMATRSEWSPSLSSKSIQKSISKALGGGNRAGKMFAKAVTVALQIVAEERFMYFNVFDEAFLSTRNEGTAFQSRKEADAVALQYVAEHPNDIAKVEVVRLRQKIGRDWIHRRVRLCERCGVCSLWADIRAVDRKPSAPFEDLHFECEDEYACVRRRSMRMGRIVAPKVQERSATIRMVLG